MSKSSRKQRKSEEKSNPNYFSWADDEVELFLNIGMDYKASKTMENIEWESCQSKYQNILDKYKEQYPSV